MKNNLSQNEQKAAVGRHAIDDLVSSGLLRAGMKMGLGTGSTAVHAVRRVSELMASGELAGLRCVPTSFQTSVLCEELGIAVYSMNTKEIGGQLDLAIDGADEISDKKHLIKGGGAAQLREKIVAYNAALFVVIADESKVVSHSLGTVFPLPVEIIPEARLAVTRALRELGAEVTLREAVRKAGPVITDNGNLVLDCLWPSTGKKPDPAILESAINEIAGVVENGFFTRNTPIVYVARADGTVEKR